MLGEFDTQHLKLVSDLNKVVQAIDRIRKVKQKLNLSNSGNFEIQSMNSVCLSTIELLL